MTARTIAQAKTTYRTNLFPGVATEPLGGSKGCDDGAEADPEVLEIEGGAVDEIGVELHPKSGNSSPDGDVVCWLMRNPIGSSEDVGQKLHVALPGFGTSGAATCPAATATC